MAKALTDRCQQILEAIIEEYIATAQPVGSKALTQNQGIRLSPASVRNVMAELEELGYLVSPHTSAGRIPTEKGYRFYVDTLLRVSESLQLLIVVYKYASRQTLVRLQERGVVTIIGPAEDLDILAHIEITQAPDADIEQPAPRFSNEELGRIAALSPGLLCECPNHIAKLLMDITSFEQYSRECQDTDPAERALHQKLGEISARARALLEDALVAVATADGIPLRTTS